MPVALAFAPSVPLTAARPLSRRLTTRAPRAALSPREAPALPRNASQRPHSLRRAASAVRTAAAIALAALTITPAPPAAAAAVAERPAAVAAPRRGRARAAGAAPLAVSTPAAAVAPAPPRATLSERAMFYFGEYLMWHPAARVVALLFLTLGCMSVGSVMFRLADPSGKEAPFSVWHAVRAIANPLEDDWVSNRLRVTSIVLAAGGMIIFGLMVGMITESVESAVQSDVMSKVVVKDHILICGWSSHVSQILKDVNFIGTGRVVKVVVLANPEEKDVMIEELRGLLTKEQRKNMKIFYRPGAPILEDDLDRVAASHAKKIIFVNSRVGNPTDSDRRILSRALALRQNLPAFTGDIVAELNSTRDAKILRSIFADTRARSVETVNSERLLFRFMAQAIRQPGLADVVATLLGENSESVFHVRTARDVAPQLVGTSFADARPTSVPGAILCGYIDDANVVQIETASCGADKGQYVLTPDTQLLLLGGPPAGEGARSGVNAVVHNDAIAEVTSGALPWRAAGSKPAAESFLVCGWREDMEDMLRELDGPGMLPRGSSVTILDVDAPIASDLNLKRLKVTSIMKRADRYENLQELLDTKKKIYDHVVLLGSALGSESEVPVHSAGMEEDTKTLATLVYVNELLGKSSERMEMRGRETRVTVEFLNDTVARIAREQGTVANAILPLNLSAKIAAQTVRDSRLNAVWEELLSQEGREVYLRSVQNYMKEGLKLTQSKEDASFATIVERACTRNGDIVLGYVDENGDMVLNPQKKERFGSRTWTGNEVMIVLAHSY